MATSVETFINEHLQDKSVATFDLNTDAYQALKDGQIDAVIGVKFSLLLYRRALN